MSSLSNWMSEDQQKAELLACVSQLFVSDSFNGRGDAERFGIGLYLGVMKDSGSIYAKNVMAGSPACKANIEVGDVLLEIDREKVQSKKLVPAQVKLFGHEKGVISLKLKKKDGTVYMADNVPFSKDQLAGVGLHLKEKDCSLVVDRLAKGGAALSSTSIKKDDELLSIDGHPVSGEFIKDVHKMLMGEVGSVVTLTLARKDDKEKYSVPLLRARISTHASDALKDIFMFLRLDNKDTFFARRQLMDWKLFQLSLVDILADPTCDWKLFSNALKVSVSLLLPIQLIDKDADPASLNKADISSRSIHINQVSERIREIKNFLSQTRNHKAIINIMRWASGCLAKEGTDRSSDDTVFLELIVHFFVNIIRPANVLERRDSPLWSAEHRDEIIVMLHKEHVIETMIWLASEIERPENRDLARILVLFFSFLLGVEDAELLLSLQAKSKEDESAKKVSVRFNQVQVPVQDSFALLLREQEQKRLEMASKMKNMRNTRISGTYKTFVGGHEASATSVIMQSGSSKFAVPTLMVPNKFGRGKLPVSDPATRDDVQGGGRSRISPAVTCLVECSESFMKSSFNSLLFAALYDIQQERENLTEVDEQAFLQLLSFGLRFNRRNKMEYEYVGAVIHVKMFQLISAMTTKYVLSSNFAALPAAVNSFRELIMVLRDLLCKARKEKDQKDLQADPSAPLPPSPAVDILRSLVEEFAVFDTLVKLVQEYESHRNSKKYLSDLIDCVHQAMRMLQEHAAWIGALRAKKIKGKKKKGKKDDIKSIRRKVQSVDADGVFKTLKPHHLNPNDVVGFDGKLPSGVEPKKLYFVLMVESDPANSFRVSGSPGGEPLLFEPTTAVFTVVRNPDNTKGAKDARALAAIEKDIQEAIEGGLADKLLEGDEALTLSLTSADGAPQQPAGNLQVGANDDDDEIDAVRKRSGDRTNRRVVASDDEDEEDLPKPSAEGAAQGSAADDSGDETDNSVLKLDEDDDKEDDIERVSFSFGEYAHRFCQSSTMSKLVPLLKSYHSNSDRLNHQLWYIMNLAVEHCDMKPMLFQLSLFEAMLPILDEPSKEPRCKELNKLCKDVIRSFFPKATENPVSYVELLFWTKFKSDMEVFEDKKPSEPVQEDDGMDDEMRQLALEMLERQKEKEKASKPKRSAADVIAALDGSEADAARSDDESEEQEATYQRGMHRSAPVTAGVKAKKVASKVWKDGEDLIIRDMVANPLRGKDLLSELEAALKIRSIGQIRHRMKVLGIEAPKRSRQHRPKPSSSHKKAGNSIPWNEEMDTVIRQQYVSEKDQASQLELLVEALLELPSLPERARTILGTSLSVAAQKVSRRIRHLGLSKRSERKSKRNSERAQASGSDQSANSDVSSSSSSGSESESERQPVKGRPAKARAASKAASAAQEQLCCHLVAEAAASGNDALMAGLVWLRTRLEAASRQEEGRTMTIVALNTEHFDVLEDERVSAWLTFWGATAPGHGMANWRLKTGSAVQAALQNLGAILSDPSAFTLSPDQLIALTSSPEEQPRQRDEFDFSDDDAALASPSLKEKRKKKRKSDGGRGSDGRGRGKDTRHRSERRGEQEPAREAAAADSDDEPVVSRSEEQAVASPAASTSPPREVARRKRVVTAAGSSDTDGDFDLGAKQRVEPTPVTEVRKRRPVVVSDDDE